MGERLVVDRYELVHELASGGMATVYLGRVRGAVGFARTVAIKRAHQFLTKDPEFVAMFLDEARLASRIRHPNVVQTLDVVSQNGELFLIMDYVHGVSLAAIERAVFATGEGVPVPIAAAIVSGMLLGLHAAHESKDEAGGALDIVHRDVSPQNVLVGADGIARVVDFGIAKAAGRLQATTDGQIKGKAAYMAPEQLGGRADRRCDVYAASVVLWELLTSRRLFHGESSSEVIAQVLAARVPLPSSIAPTIPKELEEIVMVGLDPAPEQRFPTAREMDRALQRATAMASPFEVAEWLESTMGESLRAAAGVLTKLEAESRSSLDDGVARHQAPQIDPYGATETQTVGTLPTRRHRTAWAPGIVVGMLLAAGVFGLMRARSSPPPSAEAAAVSPAVAVLPAATPTVAPSQTASSETPPAVVLPAPSTLASSIRNAVNPQGTASSVLRPARPSAAPSSTPRPGGRPPPKSGVPADWN